MIKVLKYFYPVFSFCKSIVCEYINTCFHLDSLLITEPPTFTLIKIHSGLLVGLYDTY